MVEDRETFRSAEDLGKATAAAKNNLFILEILSGSPDLNKTELLAAQDPVKLIKDEIRRGQPQGITRGNLAIAASMGLNLGILAGIEYALNGESPVISGLMGRGRELLKQIKEIDKEGK